MDKNIYVIHENDEWLIPLRESFKKIKAPFKEWHMDKESFDFKKSPPNGIFYNRMSQVHIHEATDMRQKIQKTYLIG